MTDDNATLAQYSHGSLLNTIESALIDLGKTTATTTISDLAAVDEFHIGGRQASEHFMAQLGFTDANKVLDVGCGLGGPARFVATRCDCKVTGIDLTKEFVDTGNELSQWLALSEKVRLLHGSALDIPFSPASFDGAYMMHVGMNISEKTKLFSEVARVLKSQSLFGIYDVMRDKPGELSYPLPWANDKQESFLATTTQYVNSLFSAGFEVLSLNVRREFALQFFEYTARSNQENGGPPLLSLHNLIQGDAGLKLKNLRSNIAKQLVGPVEIIARKL